MSDRSSCRVIAATVKSQHAPRAERGRGDSWLGIGKVLDFNDRIRLRDVLSASGMRRSTVVELSGMELHEVVHVARRFAGEFVHCVRHAVVAPLLVQLGHGREMADDVLRKPRLAKAFAPRREWDVAISDGPAEG